MFGIKIISTEKFCSLTNENEELKARLIGEKEKRQAAVKEINKLEKRIDQLKKDTNLELVKIKNEAERGFYASLKDLCIIREKDYPCDKCNLEGPECKKLSFANQTVCVTRKENINSFCRKTKK